MNKQLGSRKHRPCTFQFRYDIKKNNITGEFTDMLVEELQSEGDFAPTNMDNSAMAAYPFLTNDDNKMNKSEQLEDKKINYAEGVRIMYLNKEGRAMEANPDEDEDQKEDEAGEQGRQQNGSNRNNIENDPNEDAFSPAMFDSTFKTRKQLADILGNNKTPKTILRLNILGHIIMIFALTLTFIDFFVSNAQFKQIKDNVNLINLSYRRVAEIQNIIAKTRDLFLIQLKICPYQGLSNVSTEMAATSIKFITNNISQSTNLIQDIQRELQIQSKDLMINPDNIRLTTTNSITMQAKIGAAKQYDLNEATRQVVTMAINLKDEAGNSQASTPINFMANDINWYFITQNCFNDYLAGLFSSSTAYVQDLSDRTDTMGRIFLVLFLIAIIVIFLGVVCIVPSLWSVNKQKQEILGLFLYLNEEGIKVLYSKCEKLISNLQVGEDDDALSDMDDTSIEKVEKNEEGAPDGVLGKRKKNFKTNWKTNKCFLFLIVGYGLILESYFIFNFYQNKNILKDVKSLTKEINATSAAKSFFYFTSNTQAMMFLNNSQPVLSRKSEDIVKDNINNMFELDSTIHEEHSINVGIHSEDYKGIYNDMMMLKPCSIMGGLQQSYNDYVSTDICAAFASSTLGQGMALGLARHYENMRNMYSKYLQIVPNTAGTDSTAASTADIEACATQAQTVVTANSRIDLIQAGLTRIWI
jgi:hypothetical protein